MTTEKTPRQTITPNGNMFNENDVLFDINISMYPMFVTFTDNVWLVKYTQYMLYSPPIIRHVYLNTLSKRSTLKTIGRYIFDQGLIFLKEKMTFNIEETKSFCNLPGPGDGKIKRILLEKDFPILFSDTRKSPEVDKYGFPIRENHIIRNYNTSEAVEYEESFKGEFENSEWGLANYHCTFCPLVCNKDTMIIGYCDDEGDDIYLSDVPDKYRW
ncbi:MAG: hypothetical protein GY804_08730 [Alphaproteobacteria bacterium]|nr:hypothetical protein [Alphaproteobacteria bacterium]